MMKFCRLLLIAIALATAVCALSRTVSGQSSDQSLPTAVLSNEISGKIGALDLGDPRLTRHFYALEAKPGDLLITLDSRNLNGDIDVFTAITFRPLMKTTMYASAQSSEVTKGIYLRTQQILILRVEARTPGDEPGTYRIRFGGTFEPFSGGIPVAGNSATEETTPEKAGANRLSSVGATIPRPATEEPAAEPKPSPEKTAEGTETAKTTAPAKPPVTTTSRRTTPRNPRRGSRPAPSRSTAPAKETEPVDKAETAAAKKETTKATEEKPVEKPAETNPSTAEKPKPQEVAPAGAHLIIEEKDGTRIDRPMSTVRRVIVEGGTIVIVLKTGKTERIQMSEVAKFAIEPQ
jgi:hypothetical protein